MHRIHVWNDQLQDQSVITVPLYLSHLRSLGGVWPLIINDDTALVISGIANGRSASNGTTGATSSFTVGFGSASATGVWIVAVVQSNTPVNSISGGTNAWTPVASSSSGAIVYTHLVASSEPTTYTVTYSGSGKSDGAECTIFEVLNANSTNPDASGTATSSATPPSKTSSAATDASVIVWAGYSTPPTAPSGYTIQGSGSIAGTPVTGTAIASKLSVGSGAISPGAWSASGNVVGHILFKQ